MVARSKKPTPEQRKAKKPVAASAVPPSSVASGNLIPTEVAAKLLMVTPEWIRRLTKDGWIKKVAKDQYTVVDVVQGYINYLKDEQRRTSKSASASRAHDARAREIEQRIAREDGRLIQIEDVQAGVTEIMGTLRSELAGVPAASTRDIEARQMIEGQLNAAIARCRASFEKMDGDLRAGREVLVGGEAADA